MADLAAWEGPSTPTDPSRHRGVLQQVGPSTREIAGARIDGAHRGRTVRPSNVNGTNRARIFFCGIFRAKLGTPMRLRVWPLLCSVATLVLGLGVAEVAWSGPADRALTPTREEVDETAELGIGQYRALLISAQDYRSESGIVDLDTPDRDIERVGEVLQRRYGFQVDFLYDATKEQITSALQQLRYTGKPR